MEEADLKPHRSRYWLNAKEKDTDPEGFARAAADVCAAYLGAPDAHMRGEHVICTDEKTGMQALSRIARTKPTAPGRVELQEFEYRRHGTLCLTANFEVATGEICSYTISPTRTVVEFADHLERTVADDPDGRWTFVADHLNTHLSPFLVQQVARWCGITDDLGEAGKRGVLQSRASREAFLSDPTHRIRFIYTPRHCSWLNQVEIWFSVLVRRLLKRGDFRSLDELRERIVAFIKYFNAALAHPYAWTYTGRALKAA